MPRAFLAVTVAVATGLAAALTFGAPGSAEGVDCATPLLKRAAWQSQFELTYCEEQSWMAADADLNDAYQAARAVLQDIDAGLPNSERGAEDNLRNAQRAWIVFRDAACAAEGYLWHGGSGKPMVIYSCLARLTEARAADLWTLAEG